MRQLVPGHDAVLRTRHGRAGRSPSGRRSAAPIGSHDGSHARDGRWLSRPRRFGTLTPGVMPLGSAFAPCYTVTDVDDAGEPSAPGFPLDRHAGGGGSAHGSGDSSGVGSQRVRHAGRHGTVRGGRSARPRGAGSRSASSAVGSSGARDGPRVALGSRRDSALSAPGSTAPSSPPSSGTAQQRRQTAALTTTGLQASGCA